ncbi:transposase [Lewinella sp. JB7]|uniref:transposase n=1 Tax=Lewinella sp. JB7 TaxID=2962887 RepID=UPI0020C98434|nr:transposase [Lewinella sp. JB7]MCP9234644.1 transposase [Lewinella sp. JB7]
MPNHVHVLLSMGNQLTDEDHRLLTIPELSLRYRPLHEVMRRIKGGSARYLNEHLGTKGPFWQKDSYDHYVRTAKSYDNILYYILYNPEKAGLVNNWRSYPFTYYV